MKIKFDIPIPPGAEPEAISLLENAAKIMGLAMSPSAQNNSGVRALAAAIEHAFETAALHVRQQLPTTAATATTMVTGS